MRYAVSVSCDLGAPLGTIEQFARDLQTVHVRVTSVFKHPHRINNAIIIVDTKWEHGSLLNRIGEVARTFPFVEIQWDVYRLSSMIM